MWAFHKTLTRVVVSCISVVALPSFSLAMGIPTEWWGIAWTRGYGPDTSGLFLWPGASGFAWGSRFLAVMLVSFCLDFDQRKMVLRGQAGAVRAVGDGWQRCDGKNNNGNENKMIVMMMMTTTTTTIMMMMMIVMRITTTTMMIMMMIIETTAMMRMMIMMVVSMLRLTVTTITMVTLVMMVVVVATTTTMIMMMMMMMTIMMLMVMMTVCQIHVAHITGGSIQEEIDKELQGTRHDPLTPKFSVGASIDVPKTFPRCCLTFPLFSQDIERERVDIVPLIYKNTRKVFNCDTASPWGKRNYLRWENRSTNRPILCKK